MYRPWAHSLWIPAPTGVRNQRELPDMGNLPIGLYMHRVVFVGNDAFVMGGYTQGGIATKRTFRITSGEATPVELGQMTNNHQAVNVQQGMAIVTPNGTIIAAGNKDLTSRQVDILDPVTKLWSVGPLNAAPQGLSGVSLIKIPAQANRAFACWGDFFSLSEYVTIADNGAYFTTGYSGSPIAYQQPYTGLVFRVGNDVWFPNGAQGVGGAQPSLIRLKSADGINWFQSWTPNDGRFDIPWSADNAAGVLLTKGIHAGKILIAGGLENNAGASLKTWLVDITTPGNPTTTLKANMPRQRKYFTMHELDNGLVACIGGRNALNAVQAETDFYYPDTNQWFPGPSVPYGPLAFHSSARTPQGNILLVGGTTGGGNTLSNVIYLKKDGTGWIHSDQ